MQTNANYWLYNEQKTHSNARKNVFQIYPNARNYMKMKTTKNFAKKKKNWRNK